MDHADLEIAIHRRDIERYALEVRFSQPGDAADIRLMRDETVPVLFDMQRLRELAIDATAYGRFLSATLFADPRVLAAFAQAYTFAQSHEQSLRLRLYISSSALELQSLRWETLRHPEDDAPLFTGETIFFSRYLSSRDWRPVRPHSRGDLRTLVVIANPTNLHDYEMPAIDVADEIQRVQSSLADIPMTTLAAGGSANVNNIMTHLYGTPDILYLICHGHFVKGETWLWLEDADGSVAHVSGSSLIVRLKELAQRPRLVILAACQTARMDAEARSTDNGALAALGPRLAEAGVPAVLAMQDNVSMQTMTDFMLVFFRELQRDGHIDRAVTLARGAVRDRHDAWMPVLYMRLKSGKLWYSPVFAEEGPGRGAQKWPAIMQSIRNGKCTPILGPDMAETLFGSHHDIAWRLANEYEFPMDPHDREGLPQVAQYLAVNLSPNFLPSKLVEYLCQGIRDRHDDLPEAMEGLILDRLSRDTLIKLLDDLLTLAWQQRQQRLSAEPHLVLAELPIPVYITADVSNLLTTALRERGKKPYVRLCPWNADLMDMPEWYHLDDEPDEEHPLVYHLFGNLQVPESLVLTEDDFFDSLIGLTRNYHAIPKIVLERLVNSSLLFLGFGMDDWYFRVLFRTLRNQPGRRKSDRHVHIAVQIAPEEDRILEPSRARQYFEDYFQKAAISIYWGSAEDFAQEFQMKWKGDGQ
jgi:hypothetical protein